MTGEDALQAQIVAFIRVAAPDLLFFAVPNGGYRHPREAAKLKATGTVPGVPDLTFVLPGGLIGFIELKTHAGRVSSDQKAFANAAIERGAAYALCRSLNEVETTLKAWGIALRGRAQ